PGHHGDRLASLLAERGLVDRVIRYWPGFRVDRGCPGQPGLSPGREWRAYRRAAQLCWAIWRRLPLVGGWETPRAPLCALFDELARRALGPCDLFVGWAQMSLRSLEAARRLGARTLLEHPMSHVDAWMDLYREEYARFGRARAGGYSLIPQALVRRMRAEYQAAETISVLSSYARRTFLDAGVPPARILTLPLGVDADCFHPGPERQGRWRVLYVGRLELVKGVQYLLEAVARLGPDVELWLVGTLLPEMGRIVEIYAQRARLRLWGEVAPAQLPELYRQCDVFCLPTLNDAFGLVLLEAMASGLPVVATDRCAAPDLIADGVEGYLVPIRDSAALADRLDHLRRRREQARAMGARGRARVLAGFTWDHYAQRVLSAYASLLSPASCPAQSSYSRGDGGSAHPQTHPL
ncbi:MAG: glycosyltransferase family 4 protein, partial [Myxococcota bacterium]|nr:glycosyltransferase family 4 protein [Myxococcota bacterium]